MSGNPLLLAYLAWMLPKVFAAVLSQHPAYCKPLSYSWPLTSAMCYRWDPRSKDCACDIAAHVNAKGKGAVGNIISAGSASGSLVVTAGADGAVKAFDARSPLQAVSQAKLTDFPYSLAVAGGLALCGCGDGSLLVIDLSSGQTLYALGANKAAVRGVHASKNCLVCMGDDGSVYMYNFAQ